MKTRKLAVPKTPRNSELDVSSLLWLALDEKSVEKLHLITIVDLERWDLAVSMLTVCNLAYVMGICRTKSGSGDSPGETPG